LLLLSPTRAAVRFPPLVAGLKATKFMHQTSAHGAFFFTGRAFSADGRTLEALPAALIATHRRLAASAIFLRSSGLMCRLGRAVSDSLA
jgi:hypothetical protein